MGSFVTSDKYTSLLVVGNGFDCSLGAKTTYEAFYGLLSKAFNAVSFNNFLEEIDKAYNRDALESFFNLVSQERLTNYFINYFILYNKAFDCWVDFEKELEKIIISFDSLVTILLDKNKTQFNVPDFYLKLTDNLSLISVILNYPKNNYFHSFQVGKDFYIFHIQGCSFKSEKVLINELEKFISSFPKNLYKDLSLFSKLFVTYLSIIENDVTYSKEHAFIKGCEIAINYNYTNYLEHFYKRNNYSSQRILYINGKCDYEKLDDKIVFGIDSNVIIKNKQFFIFTKTAQRSIKNTDIRYLTNFFTYYYFTKIIIYGHSLSAADKETLQYILKKSKYADSKDFKIIIYCYNEDTKLNIISNLKEILGLEYLIDLQNTDKLIFKDIE